jgi:ribosomal protein S18 acetylase RimI-like enzyme
VFPQKTMLQPQPFDTEVFGAPVARLIEPVAFAPDRNPDEWRTQKIWLVSCRIPADDDRDIGLRLRNGGFRHVETQVTLQRDLRRPIPSPSVAVEQASNDDIAGCQQIARTAFTVSRYNLDPEVDQTRASEYKARWVENSIRGRADAAFIVRSGGRIDGFNFCLKQNGAAIVDLIAVAPESQRQGVGKAMLLRALDHYSRQVDVMRVSTQAQNPRSLSMYASCGFHEVSRAVTYHWTNREAAP